MTPISITVDTTKVILS